MAVSCYHSIHPTVYSVHSETPRLMYHVTMVRTRAGVSIHVGLSTTGEFWRLFYMTPQTADTLPGVFLYPLSGADIFRLPADVIQELDRLAEHHYAMDKMPGK